MLKALRGVVGNDSGLMHLAARAGRADGGALRILQSRLDRAAGPGGAVVTATASLPPCYRRTCNQPVFCLETVARRRMSWRRCNATMRRRAAAGGEHEP